MNRKQVERITGMNGSRITGYADLLTGEKPGRGKNRKYNRLDVALLTVIESLDDMGFKLATIKTVTERVKRVYLRVLLTQRHDLQMAEAAVRLQKPEQATEVEEVRMSIYQKGEAE